MTTRTSHLYKITDLERNKFYIGKHLGDTQGSYWGSGTRIVNHVNKYGIGSLKYEILVLGTEEYIYSIEAAYVDKEFLAQNPNCLNILVGGKSDYSAKCGSTIGRAAPNKGKKASFETRAKLRLAKLGKRGNRTGVPVSEETKRKLSIAKTGKKLPKSVGEKLRLIHTGRVHKKVKCTHCGLLGGITTMNRWHFDRCKHKDQNVC